MTELTTGTRLSPAVRGRLKVMAAKLSSTMNDTVSLGLSLTGALGDPALSEAFITFLANRLPSDGLTKAQILRMADRLMHGGTWREDHVVTDVRTPLELAQERILELERKLDEMLEVKWWLP